MLQLVVMLKSAEEFEGFVTKFACERPSSLMRPLMFDEHVPRFERITAVWCCAVIVSPVVIVNAKVVTKIDEII